MTPTELEKLTDDLQKEKATLENELARFAVKNPSVRGDYQSVFPKTEASDTPDEKAHSVTSYEEERAVEQNLELRLKEVNDTLAKLSAGAYGQCERCQLPIEAKRLQAMPAVRHCADCAKRAQLV